MTLQLSDYEHKAAFDINTHFYSFCLTLRNPGRALFWFDTLTIQENTPARQDKCTKCYVSDKM